MIKQPRWRAPLPSGIPALALSRIITQLERYLECYLLDIHNSVTPKVTNLSCENPELLVHPTGFEPVAFGLGIRRSILLSYGCILHKAQKYRHFAKRRASHRQA